MYLRIKCKFFISAYQALHAPAWGRLFPAYLSPLSLLDPVLQAQFFCSRNIINSILLQHMALFFSLSELLISFFRSKLKRGFLTTQCKWCPFFHQDVSVKHMLANLSSKCSSQSEMILLFVFIHCPPFMICTPSQQSPSLSRLPVDPCHLEMSLAYSRCSVNICWNNFTGWMGQLMNPNVFLCDEKMYNILSINSVPQSSLCWIPQVYVHLGR